MYIGFFFVLLAFNWTKKCGHLILCQWYTINVDKCKSEERKNNRQVLYKRYTNVCVMIYLITVSARRYLFTGNRHFKLYIPTKLIPSNKEYLYYFYFFYLLNCMYCTIHTHFIYILTKYLKLCCILI